MEIERDRYLKELLDCRHDGLVKIITGLRRSGKSYLLFKIFKQQLLSEGIREDHIIEMAFDDFSNKEYRSPDKFYAYVKEKIIDSDMYYILLDEVQLLEDFVDVLNGFLHIDNADVYVTGSNAKFLSKDVITEFRGRGNEIRIHPLSFKEFYSVGKYENHEQCLLEYMTYGGLPKVADTNEEDSRKEYLEKLFTHTYLTDIKERYNIQMDDDLEELINILASSIGGFTNPKKLADTFNSVKKSSISQETIKKYIDYITDSFLLEKSVRYDIKGKKYINTPAKYYFEDLGLRNARLNFRQTEQTHLMENMIYNELRLRGYSVDVGQVTINTKNANDKSERKQLEVDFVCNQGDQRIYIQSAYSIQTQEKQEQELRSLQLIKDSFPKVIIAGGTQPTYKNNDGILILNIFDFLLEDDCF